MRAQPSPHSNSFAGDSTALTNTDDGETLVAHDGVVRLVAARPVGPTVPELLGEGDGPRPERSDVALAVVANEDAAHGETFEEGKKPGRRGIDWGEERRKEGCPWRERGKSSLRVRGRERTKVNSTQPAISPRGYARGRPVGQGSRFHWLHLTTTSSAVSQPTAVGLISHSILDTRPSIERNR